MTRSPNSSLRFSLIFADLSVGYPFYCKTRVVVWRSNFMLTVMNSPSLVIYTLLKAASGERHRNFLNLKFLHFASSNPASALIIHFSVSTINLLS